MILAVNLGGAIRRWWIIFFFLSLVNRLYVALRNHYGAFVKDCQISTTCDSHPLTKGASRNLSSANRQINSFLVLDFTYKYVSEHFTLLSTALYT